MKLGSHANSLQTNVKEIQSHNFGIGDAGVVIEILRNKLYENPIQTLVQEYICNGRDANRESKTNKALSIVVPTTFSPTFKVRDYGLGISPDRVANVFVLYGSSTKRDSNNMTGGFGIGAKSAWSYTDSFTVTTFIDGTKRSYLCHTGSNNEGKMDLISTSKTDEYNGTLIEIAIKPHDASRFKEAIYRAVKYWETDKWEIKGAPTDEISAVSFFKNKPEINFSKWVLGETYNYGQKVIALVDGIPYSVDLQVVFPQSHYSEVMENIKGTVYLRMNNGDIEVSASREKLSYSKSTIQMLKDCIKNVKTEARQFIADESKKCKTVSDLLTKGILIDKWFSEFELTVGDVTVRYGHLGFTEKSGLKFKMYQNRSGRGMKSPKIKEYEQNFINRNDINNIFYKDDKNESATMMMRRIRNHLRDKNPSTIFVVDNLSASLLKELNAKPLSSLVLPAVERRIINGVSVRRTGFIYHEVGAYGSRDTKSIMDLDEWNNQGITMIYLGMDDVSRDKKYPSSETMLRRKAKLIALSKENIRMIEEDDRFQKFDEWENELEFTTDEIKSAATYDVDSDLQTIKKNLAKLTLNTELTNLVHEIDDCFKSDKKVQVQGCEWTMDRIVKLPEYKTIKEITKRFVSTLSTKYPLVNEYLVDSYSLKPCFIDSLNVVIKHTKE